MPTTAVHASAVRPVLTFSVERELAIIEGVTVAGLTFGVGFSLPALLVAAGIVAVVHPLLRLAAKNDPQMFRIYVRHVGYQAFYPASAHPSAPTLRPLPWVR